MEITIYSAGGKTSTKKVSKDLFGVDMAGHAVAKTVHVQLGNARTPIAKTKTKSHVQGGGRKPYRQKGTGHARQGSTRNPHYKGGGVAFGNTGTENYSGTVPLKEKRLALFGLLSTKVAGKKLFAIDAKATGKKTKEAQTFLASLPYERSAVVYYNPEKDEVAHLSNLADVTLRDYRRVNVVDLAKADGVVFTTDALEAFEKLFV